MFRESVSVIIQEVQQVEKTNASEVAGMKRSTQQMGKSSIRDELYGLETTGYRINN